MSGEFQISLNYRNVRYASAELGLVAVGETIQQDWADTGKALSTQLRLFLTAVVEALAAKNSGSWPGGTTDSSVSSRSGELVSGILKSVTVAGTVLSAIEARLSLPETAAIHERGGTIRAKSSPWLTVPLPAALDSKGNPIKKSSRDWGNTFVAETRNGNLVIFQRNLSTITPLYVLKTQVTVKARLGAEAALMTGLPYFVGKAVDAMCRQMMGT